MITPNKSIPLKGSIIYKSIYILEKDFQPMCLFELYNNVKNKFDGVDEFIYSIDVLHLLDLVKVDFELGTIEKC